MSNPIVIIERSCQAVRIIVTSRPLRLETFERCVGHAMRVFVLFCLWVSIAAKAELAVKYHRLLGFLPVETPVPEPGSIVRWMSVKGNEDSHTARHHRICMSLGVASRTLR